MAVTVFISYAHKDRELRQELDNHLSMLRHLHLIEDWYDGQIVPGQEWEQEIISRLNSAQVILLLISSDFLASTFCYGIEMGRAITRHDAGEAFVIPILIRSVVWEGAPFAKLQALPTNAKPVANWSVQDDGWTNVVEGIQRAIEHRFPQPHTTPPSSQVKTAEGSHLTSPRNTFWNVPLRNPFFLGREDVFTHLHSILAQTRTANLTQPPAINGFGGIGKTQTALEYAYRYRKEYAQVFWVRAATVEELVTDYTAIAHLLDLPQQDEQDQTIIVHAVRAWFEAHSGWLLIYDNADDLSLVAAHLPQGNTGHLVLTTRTQIMAGLTRKIELDTMSGDDGVLFLLRRANIISLAANLTTLSEQTRALAQEIVTELGGLPLALDQAGAYIEETASNLSGYLALFREEKHRLKLLRQRGGIVPSHPLSVSATVSLAVEKVADPHPAAAALLHFCAFLAPEGIPERIFTEGASQLGPELQSVAEDAYEFDQTLKALLTYSLIRRETTTTTLTIHRLVQVVLKDSMDQQSQHVWAERVVKAVNDAFPRVDLDTHAVCQSLLPHAQVCASLISQWSLDVPEAAQLLNQTGSYLQDRVQYAQALPLYERALAIREHVLDPQHPDTATSLNNLAMLYKTQGDYAQALPLYKRALAIREHVLGPQHPDTATSLNNLAALYDTQGDYAQALPLLQRALAIYEKALGPQHPNTKVIRANYDFVKSAYEHE